MWTLRLNKCYTPMLCLPSCRKYAYAHCQTILMPYVHLSLRGLTIPALFMDGGTGRSFMGGAGRGPVGGGCRTESGGLARGFRLFIMEPLLLVLGGNIGRCEASMADAGSGMLSRSLYPERLAREPPPLRGSLVSRERCCKDRGGGGDFSTIPVGVCCVAS